MSSIKPVLMWNFADTTERDATGSNDGLALEQICYVQSAQAFYRTTVVNPTSSTWVEVSAGGGAGSWATVLAAGNTSGGTNPVISSLDKIEGQTNLRLESQNGDLELFAGLLDTNVIVRAAQGSVSGNGGDTTIESGESFVSNGGGTTSASGSVFVRSNTVNSTNGASGDVVISTAPSAGTGNTGDVTMTPAVAGGTGLDGLTRVSQGPMFVSGAAVLADTTVGAQDLIVGDFADIASGMTFFTSTMGTATIQFADTSGLGLGGKIAYDHTADQLQLATTNFGGKQVQLSNTAFAPQVNNDTDLGTTGQLWANMFSQLMTIGVEARTTSGNLTFFLTQMDVSGSNRTLTLPEAAIGKWFLVHLIDPAAQTLTIDGQSGDTINGTTATTGVVIQQADTIVFMYAEDSTAWHLLEISVVAPE